MEDIDVVDKINHAGSWLVNNQELSIHYAVNIVAAIIILFIGLLISRIVARTLNRMMTARHIDATVSDFVSAIFRYGIVIFTLIAALNRMGVQTASVISVIGAAGLAIGLALQGALSNFAAGVLLVTFRHFRAGDYVDFSGTSGTVLVVQIFSTTLKTYDGKIVVVPNSKILSGNITNFFQEPNRLIDTIISVSYDADIDVVKKLITDILVADSRVIQDMGLGWVRPRWISRCGPGLRVAISKTRLSTCWKKPRLRWMSIRSVFPICKWMCISTARQKRGLSRSSKRLAPRLHRTPPVPRRRVSRCNRSPTPIPAVA